MPDIKDIIVPAMGESITEGTIANWLKKPGDGVAQDEAVVEIETDKVTVEVNSPVAGVFKEALKTPGSTVKIGEVIARVEAGAAPARTATAPVKAAEPAIPATAEKSSPSQTLSAGARNDVLPPAAAKMVAENRLNPAEISGSGRHGQVLKEDVQRHLASSPGPAAEKPAAKAPAEVPKVQVPMFSGGEEEKVVPMSKLRQAIARNLVNVQHNAAILTTFNEIDMKNLMDLRSRYKDAFAEKFGVKLGFMSFFTRAVIHALREIPAINAEIREESIVYKNYYHVGIAVGGPKGLVVPVVRHADKLSLAQIEAEIARLAGKVKDGSISLADLQGGTFTITNGGIYGSMMSTPILNPPQSGILGMHNIVNRPMAVGPAQDKIEIRPMMYVALSYDHRIVDGKEAVQFLVKVKQAVEDPARLVLEV